MLGLYPKGFHLPVLTIVGGRQGVESYTLEVTLVINMTPKVIKNPLNRTRVREERKTILERQSVS